MAAGRSSPQPCRSSHRGQSCQARRVAMALDCGGHLLESQCPPPRSPAPQATGRAVHAGIGSFPLEPASYDVISLLTVLPHLPLRETLIYEDAARSRPRV